MCYNVYAKTIAYYMQVLYMYKVRWMCKLDGCGDGWMEYAIEGWAELHTICK